MKQKKNKKIPRNFYIDFIADEAIFQHIEQVDMLCQDMSERLLTEIVSKGYAPINKPKLQPYSNFHKAAPKNSYRISIKTIYVGKKKAMEEIDEFKKSLYKN